MANLAIKGHATRGKEVIKILEMLGGKNIYKYNGNYDSLYYYIGKNNIIYYCHIVMGQLSFTLEKFLKKFPYKIGDKVIYKSEIFPIIGMKWCFFNNTVIYTMKSNYGTIDCYDSTWIKPYKKETMEKEISGAIVDRFICLEGYDFYDDKGNIIDTKEITMKKKKPKYPNTYEDCCKVLLLNPEKATYSVCGLEYKRHLIVNFQRLIICRDSYWKIAGEQMGLRKPWKPDWDTQGDNKYVIEVYRNNVRKNSQGYSNTILSFPTSEMRDTFYDNFKKLIEQCKEFL